MNIFGLYVYSRDKKLIQQFCPIDDIYSIDSIVQKMNLIETNYLTFAHDNKVFHVLTKLDKIVIGVTTHSYPRRLAIQLLEDIDNSMLSAVNKSINLSRFYSKYNDYEKIDQLALTQAKVSKVKDVMHENINKILENQIKIESIDIKSEDLMQSAGIFAKTSKELKNKIWWKNFRLKLYIGLVVVTILGLIIGIAVGTSNSKPSSSK